MRAFCSNLGVPIYRSVNYDPLDAPPEAWQNETTMACIPEYPCQRDGWYQLPEILKVWLPEPKGWSSHTTHWDDMVMAQMGGATVLEKHFKLSNNDAEAHWSLNPDQFGVMVNVLRTMERKWKQSNTE